MITTTASGAVWAQAAFAMKISLFAGDLCDVDAEVLCTSTNPRLSLAMGTGGSVRSRGGYDILRACEAIVDEEFVRTGRRGLPAGSAHLTGAGALPAKAIVHCVASDASHRSSLDIVRKCVQNALAIADANGFTSMAMPLFGTGHARLKFDRVVRVMTETLRDETTAVRHVFIVVFDEERVDEAAELVRRTIPSVDVDIQRGPQAAEEVPGVWSAWW